MVYSTAVGVFRLYAQVLERCWGMDKNTAPIDEIVKLYLDGNSTAAIGELFGCSHATIRRILAAAGIKMRHPGRVAVPIDMDEIKRLRDDGVSLESIASRFGVSRSALMRRCIKHGIVYGKGHSPSNTRANHSPSRVMPKGGVSKEVRERRLAERVYNETEYEYVSGYESAKKPVLIRCRVCGDEIWIAPHALLDKRHDHSCVKCRRTQKEAEIEEKRRRRENEKLEELSKPKTCLACGETFYSEYKDQLYCSAKCKNKSRDHNHRARARKYGVEYDGSITWKSLSDELGHCNCQICGEPCDPNDTRWNGNFGPLYPTVDCIVAMKNGGGYVRGNVQLAHAMCNSIKRDLEDSDDIFKAIDDEKHARRNGKRHEVRTTALTCACYCRDDRQRGRITQHSAAFETVSRDDSGNIRIRGCA